MVAAVPPKERDEEDEERELKSSSMFCIVTSVMGLTAFDKPGVCGAEWFEGIPDKRKCETRGQEYS